MDSKDRLKEIIDEIRLMTAGLARQLDEAEEIIDAQQWAPKDWLCHPTAASASTRWKKNKKADRVRLINADRETLQAIKERWARGDIPDDPYYKFIAYDALELCNKLQAAAEKAAGDESKEHYVMSATSEMLLRSSEAMREPYDTEGPGVVSANKDGTTNWATKEADSDRPE